MKSEQKKILVVDDDPDILEVVQLLLEGEGYLTRTATEASSVARCSLDGSGSNPDRSASLTFMTVGDRRETAAVPGGMRHERRRRSRERPRDPYREDHGTENLSGALMYWRNSALSTMLCSAPFRVAR